MLVLVEYSPLLVTSQNSVHLPLPVLALQQRPRLGLVMIVQLLKQDWSVNANIEV